MLEAAERLFAEADYHQVSVDEIAERSGVSKPMVYAYFGSKEGVYLSCAERGRADLVEAISAATDRDDEPAVVLHAGIEAFFAFVGRRADTWAVMSGNTASRTGAFAAETDRLRSSLAQLVGQMLTVNIEYEGAAPYHLHAVEPLAHALVGAAEALARWWRSRPDEPVATPTGLLMNFAWMGFDNLLADNTWAPPDTEPASARDGARPAPDGA